MASPNGLQFSGARALGVASYHAHVKHCQAFGQVSSVLRTGQELIITRRIPSHIA